MDYNNFKEYGVAEQAMKAYAEQCRTERIAVRLHEPRKVGQWQRVALAVAMVAVVVGVAWLSRPEIYGYINGEPIYSLVEAQQQAEQIMANLSQGSVDEENILQSLFTIE